MSEITKDQAKLYRAVGDIVSVRGQQDDPEVRKMLTAACEIIAAAALKMPILAKITPYPTISDQVISLPLASHGPELT